MVSFVRKADVSAYIVVFAIRTLHECRIFRPRTFRQCKMPKVDVSAITINLCTFECINLVVSMLMCVWGMYEHVFTCMHAG